MSENSAPLSRRFMLKSAGATVALPILESLASFAPRAMGKSFQEGFANADIVGGVGSPSSTDGVPKRLVFIPMGYGVFADGWFPSAKKTTSQYDLPPLVKAFKPVQEDISFYQNITNRKPKDPHAGTSTWMTAETLDKTKGSCDQLAAELLGKSTRLDYITVGNIIRAGGHGTMPSFGKDGKPVRSIKSAMELYEEIFGTKEKSSGASLELLRRERSSLDAIFQDAKRMSSSISAEDKDRVDEYFTAIRNMEKRLTKAMSYASRAKPRASFSRDKTNEPKSKGQGAYILDLVFDMFIIAMKSDTTRVLTYALPSEHVISKHPHRISHTQGQPFKANSLSSPTAQRDLAYSAAVSKFLIKMKESKEPDGKSLLYHSTVSYGSSLRLSHNASNPPLIIAGQGGGGIKQGRVVDASGHALGDIWLSILNNIGVEGNKFGNSMKKGFTLS